MYQEELPPWTEAAQELARHPKMTGRVQGCQQGEEAQRAQVLAMMVMQTGALVENRASVEVQRMRRESQAME